MNIKETFPYRVAKRVYSHIERLPHDLKRMRYKKPLRNILTEINKDDDLNNLSIISSNCFAGRIMQDLGLKYNSPTLGLYFMYPDFIDFLKNFQHYITEGKLHFVNESKYELGNKRLQDRHQDYPVGLLDDKIEIHFLHYKTADEATEKWYRRAQRVNLDNLLIIGMQQNLCEEKDIIEFDNLPFENKIIFTNRNLSLPSNIYVPEFNGKEEVGNPYTDAPIFYKNLINHYSNRQALS